jgi:hypothetical protein
MVLKRFTTRYIKVSETNELIKFIKVAYGENYILTNKNFFDWYINPPRMKNNKETLPVIGAFLGENIIGHMFVIPHFFSNKTGNKLAMVWNSNFMVLPEFQQKGIGPAIVRHIFNDKTIDVSAGTGASLQQKGGRTLLSAMGYNFSFMNKYVFAFDERILDIMKDPSQEDRETIKKGLSLFADYKHEKIRLIEVHLFDQRFTRFWQRTGASRFYGTWRDADFLNWRYVSHSIFKYYCVAIEDEKNEIRGFFVWRKYTIASLGLSVGRVVEFVAEDGFIHSLLHALISSISPSEVSMMDFYITTKIFDNEMSKIGFVSDKSFTSKVPRYFEPIEHKDPFVNIVFKNIHISDSNSNFDKSYNWYATSADGDQDRPNSI